MELDDEHGRPLTGWGPGHMCVSRNRISRRTSLYCGPETTTTTSQTRRGYIRRRPGPFTECVRRDIARLSRSRSDGRGMRGHRADLRRCAVGTASDRGAAGASGHTGGNPCGGMIRHVCLRSTTGAMSTDDDVGFLFSR